MKLLDFDTREAPISFIDLEMTGLESAKHEIIEIGLVKASQPDLEIIEKWEIRVKPEQLETSDPEALKVAQYDKEKWQNAVSLFEAMNILALKIDRTILAGWNVATDYSFLDQAFSKTGIQLNFFKHILDINSYTKARLNMSWGSGGLSNTCKKLGVTRENEHTALSDALATYEIYRICVNNG